MGSPAFDALLGDVGSDFISGGDGSDRIYGGPGADAIYGGAGRDRIETGPGADVVLSGPGNDEIIVHGPCGEEAEAKWIDAGLGDNDIVYLGTGVDPSRLVLIGVEKVIGPRSWVGPCHLADPIDAVFEVHGSQPVWRSPGGRFFVSNEPQTPRHGLFTRYEITFQDLSSRRKPVRAFLYRAGGAIVLSTRKGISVVTGGWKPRSGEWFRGFLTPYPQRGKHFLALGREFEDFPRQLTTPDAIARGLPLAAEACDRKPTF